ncbi:MULTISPECIES: MarR family winged helix-turn-helix transcriptional regulator [Bradyrhizobium]|uniref:MarR family winged helix-turn-helix transcriptional regulator n=1 Tax=Bradyrhizobium TaxID=374 RepID=UPI002163FE8B|nr:MULTISPECIES: MarR family transcriptional regulator [Bradyrhizobium]
MSNPKLRSAAPIPARRQASRADTRPQQADRASESAVSLKKLNGLAGYLIRQAQLWVFEDFNATLGPLQLRPVYFSILTIVGENPGLSQMALSQVLGVVRSALVPMLDGLEARDLLDRTPSKTDRRSHALYLTPEGKALLERAEALVQEHEKRLVKKVGASGHKQLLQILSVFGKQP